MSPLGPAIECHVRLVSTIVRDEPLPFIDTIEATLVDVTEPEQPCYGGTVVAHRMFAARAEQHAMSAFDVGDADTDGMCELCFGLFGDEGVDIDSDLEHRLGGEVSNPADLIYIEYIGLTPSLRGQDMGAYVIDYLTDCYARGLGLCVISLRPLQHDIGTTRGPRFDSRLELERLPTDETASLHALERHARALGFVAVEYPFEEPFLMTRRIDPVSHDRT